MSTEDESEGCEIMMSPESVPAQLEEASVDFDNDADVAIDVINNDFPDALPTEKETDSLIAQQLTKLSMKDREKVYYDLHGISEEIKETPTMIAAALVDLETELQALQDKEAYEMAYNMNPEYVKQIKLRLKFLRAELFDAKKAALRMARHFQVKLDLFGSDKLSRDIQQVDLDSDATKALYSGYMQILPVRDRSGRLISLTIPHINNRNFSIESKV